MGATLDTLGRPVRDLRISVTDRCNFRCVYCMPREVYGRDYAFLPRSQVLSFEEIARVAGAFHGLGVRKLRLTGGEPLLRRELERLVAMLAALPDAEVTMTTNGALLARKAQLLADAGLARVTVSLDSVDEDVFREMNDVDVPLAQVLEGIDAAAAAGLPVKVNTVVKRGLNDDGIVDLAARFRGTGHVLRFIEFMDVGSTNGWRLDDVVPAAEIVARIGDVFPLEPLDPNYRGETARRWRYADGSRRDRRHRLRDGAVLRRLHPGAPLGRRQALHLPLRDDRAATCARSSAATRATRSSSGTSRTPGAFATTATPSSARPRPRRCRRSR